MVKIKYSGPILWSQIFESTRENFEPWCHQKFQPFEKVIVKRFNGWIGDFYSHYDDIDKLHYTIGGCAFYDNEILPYDSNKKSWDRKMNDTRHR